MTADVRREVDDHPHEAASRFTRWSLLEYGFDPESPDLQAMSFEDLYDVLSSNQDRFRERETHWWAANLTTSQHDSIQAIVGRYTLGGEPSSPVPVRPFDYVVIGTYRDLPIDLRRALIDRGLATSIDPISTHFVLLNGCKAESHFSLALDPIAHERLRVFAHQLRENRPDTERLMIAKDGSLPPDRGHGYDHVEFVIAENGVAGHYRRRDDDREALAHAIAACRSMIARSDEFLALFRSLDRPLPIHKGFEQLAIVLDKQGNQGDAIHLCQQAKREGWSGDWDKRIQRYEAKLRRKR